MISVLAVFDFSPLHLPPVHPESVAVSHGLADQVRARLPAPPPVKDLAPATVERFRELYPRIDPHACKEGM